MKLPQILSLPPAYQKAGKNCWAFQVCPDPRGGREGRHSGSPADTPPSSGTWALSRRVSRRQRPSAWRAARTVLSPPREGATFLRPLRADGSRLPSPPRRRACCLAISRGSGCSPAQRVPLLFAGERVAALRIPAPKAPVRGRSPGSAPCDPPHARDPQLQRTDAPRCPSSSEVLTSPQSLRFPRRLLHRPIAPQRLLSFQMGRQRSL